MRELNVAPDDPRAEPLYRQLTVGFASEVLRTDYLAKQLVRELTAGAHPYGGGVRAAAAEPTVFVVGSPHGTGGPLRGPRAPTLSYTSVSQTRKAS